MSGTGAAQRRGRVETRLRAVLRDGADPVAVAARNWRRHGFGAEPYVLGALSVLRTEQMIRRSNDTVLGPHRLTHSRHEALCLLVFSRAGAMPLKRLSQHLFAHPTRITSTVDSLERLGLAERVPHPTDRRTTLARVTEAGRAVVDETCRALADGRAALGDIDEGQAAAVVDILRRVREAAGDIKPCDGVTDSSHDPVAEAAANWRKHGWDAGRYFEAGLSIVRAEELVRRSTDRSLRPLGLTHARHEALALLYFARNGSMTMGRLGQKLLIQPTSVTSTVDTLARLELAERTPHPSDRRAMLARITPLGRTVLEECCHALAADRMGIGILAPHEAVDLYEALRPLRQEAGEVT